MLKSWFSSRFHNLEQVDGHRVSVRLVSGAISGGVQSGSASQFQKMRRLKGYVPELCACAEECSPILGFLAGDSGFKSSSSCTATLGLLFLNPKASFIAYFRPYTFWPDTNFQAKWIRIRDGEAGGLVKATVARRCEQRQPVCRLHARARTAVLVIEGAGWTLEGRDPRATRSEMRGGWWFLDLKEQCDGAGWGWQRNEIITVLKFWESR